MFAFGNPSEKRRKSPIIWSRDARYHTERELAVLLRYCWRSSVEVLFRFRFRIIISIFVVVVVSLPWHIQSLNFRQKEAVPCMGCVERKRERTAAEKKKFAIGQCLWQLYYGVRWPFGQQNINYVNIIEMAKLPSSASNSKRISIRKREKSKVGRWTLVSSVGLTELSWRKDTEQQQHTPIVVISRNKDRLCLIIIGYTQLNVCMWMRV